MKAMDVLTRDSQNGHLLRRRSGRPLTRHRPGGGGDPPMADHGGCGPPGLSAKLS
jgi:hypothetical protein